MDVRQGGQRTVLFELSRFLNLKTVEADGHPIEFIHNQAIEGTQLSRRGNDLVAAVFPRPLNTGEHIELHFVYEGDVLSEAGGGLLYVGARGTWFPNRRLAMSNFDLEFRYPTGWTLVATGKRMQETPGQENGEQVFSLGIGTSFSAGRIQFGKVQECFGAGREHSSGSLCFLWRRARLPCKFGRCTAATPDFAIRTANARARRVDNPRCLRRRHEMLRVLLSFRLNLLTFLAGSTGLFPTPPCL